MPSTCALPYFIICNRCRFCSCPSISYSIDPWTNTWYPYNPVRFLRRSRGKVLYPCILLPALQSAFRIFCICTVIKASFSSFRFFYIIHPKQSFGKRFYRIALPSKKLSKNPLTSKPHFSKLAIKLPTLAIRNRLFL